MCVRYSLSRVWLFATPWAVAHQVPLSMGFSRQEYWSGLLFFSPGEKKISPDPGIISRSPALQADSLLSEPPRKPQEAHQYWFVKRRNKLLSSNNMYSRMFLRITCITCMSIYLSIQPFTYLPIHPSFIYPSIHPSFHLCICKERYLELCWPNVCGGYFWVVKFQMPLFVFFILSLCYLKFLMRYIF